jgi:hypothetical protein
MQQVKEHNTYIVVQKQLLPTEYELADAAPGQVKLFVWAFHNDTL